MVSMAALKPTRSRARIGARDICVHLHRYAGLLLAGFLFMAGLTGSVIAFQEEVDTWLNPDLFTARATGPTLDPSEMVARAQQQDPTIRLSYFFIVPEPGRTLEARVVPKTDPATGKPYELDYDRIYTDPASGEILGKRKFGACCFSRADLVPFLYMLHAQLTIGPTGLIIMGSVAMLWMLDCFIGFYLTLPRGRPFLRKWKAAWQIKRGAGAYRLNFDLHRAGGLWLWLVLLTLAVSGIYLTLSEPVFRPVVSLFSEVTPSPITQARQRLQQGLHDTSKPRLSLDAAVAIAGREAAARGWHLRPTSIFDAEALGAYGVFFFPSLGDRGTGLGTPVIYLDDRSGEIIRLDVPGEGSAGDIFIRAQFPLHSGQVAGLPGRIFISATGLLVATLSVTGVVIWAKKWRVRREKSPQPRAMATGQAR